MYRPLSLPLLALLTFTLAACSTGNGEPEFECADHEECLDDEACLGEVCTDEPEAGEDCPDYEGVEYEELACEDGTWTDTGVPADLAFATSPPAEATAGTAFEFGVEVVDEDGERVDRPNIAIVAEVVDPPAERDLEATETTDEFGVADFELTVETAATDLVVEATADHTDLHEAEASSEPFDVVAAPADADHSTITGESGLEADGSMEADVTIELADQFDNPVAGVVPQFSASGEGNEYEDCTETDADGIADCAMTTTEAGQKTLEITDPVSATGQTIEFVPACDTEAEPLGGGDGTPEDPYRLCAPDHLVAAGGTLYTHSHFLVTRDIDMIGVTDLEPIGTSAITGDGQDHYLKTFDGNGRTIENLTINGGDEAFTGLIGALDGSGEIRDLVLRDVVVTNEAGYAGGLVGANYGHIENVDVTGTVIVESGASERVGGVVGSNNGTVTRARADVDIDTESGGAGGLVGVHSSGMIRDSFAVGDVTGEWPNLGGFAGYNAASIEEAYATGDVSGDDDNTGGFVGNNFDGSIEDAYSTGSVDGPEETAGFANNGDDADVRACYWDTETSGTDDDPDCTGLETGEFADDDNFDGWDFANTWVIDEAPDGVQRPVLQWQ